VPDVQGSIVASLDASSGALTKGGFQAYGESGTTAGAFGYTGARVDAETNGLYDFRARSYSPTLGRFLQTDPIGVQGGFNLYGYVGNDPLNWVDPMGTTADNPHGGGIGAAILNNPGKVVGGGLALGGAVACLILEPCGAVVATGTGVTVLTTETVVAGGTIGAGAIMMMAPSGGGGPKSSGNEPAIKSAGEAPEPGKGLTYLYQKIGAEGQHLKFGITNNPATRYTSEELAGGRLKILAQGPRKEMLQLERNLHETLPIGPEEGQGFYIQKQIENALKPPPYSP
jgi:RHS repeat-associated protein